MTNDPNIPFRRAAVEPVECFKTGWNLIKDQYWLFLGLTLVALIIGGAVPLGILLGPMMCGLYLVFLKKRRGEPIEFGQLFKGFDYFGASVVATLLHMAPVVVIVVPAYILFYVGMFATIAVQGDNPNPGAMFGFFGFAMLVWVVIILLIVVVSIGFTFVYPLIVDRGLGGVDAVKLSFRAAMANFWRLLGLALLNTLLSICGLLLCIVGAYLILPISYAAIATAYEQVFGLREGELMPDLPPPPPSFM